jgi:ribonucleotide monophosphatase NagD (HAD superfamily)
MVGAVSGSTQREPLVVGKPSTFMMDYLSNKYIFQMPYSHSPRCLGCN